MGIVRLLDAETINQIAAGEVVDRPSSIVKELVENAIDSKATAVTVEIKGGGISYLRVTDNGCGIAREDVPQAFLRHATSKIRSKEDLSHILSLGFRGEALSSISAISHVELLTKRAEDLLGTRYVVNGGVEEGISDVGCPDGTTFLVRDVFYNVPARKKFLRSAMTEAGYITELMYRLAVSHPEISFSFINQGRTALYTSGNGNLRDAIYSVYGREISSNLIPIEKECDGFSVSGFLGKPAVARGNRSNENYFLNGRYIQSRVLNKAIEEAYKPHIMQHKFPFTCLMLRFDPERIDINVHPSKMEVRIEQQELVYEQLHAALAQALRNSILIPEVRLTEETPVAAEKPLPPPEIFETKRRQEYAAERQESVVEEDSPYTVGEQVTLRSLFSASAETSDAARPQENAAAPRYDGSLPDDPEAETAGKIAEESQNAGGQPTEAADMTAAANGAQTQTARQAADGQQTGEAAAFDDIPSYRVIGQLFGTYWLLETENQLYMIDQHAAHEKILYERTVAAYRNHEVMSQQVSPPIILSLSLREEEAYLRYRERFAALGFVIEPFGGHEYAMSAVPVDLYRLSEEELFCSLLDQLVETPVFGPADVILEKIASMSCKAAIKGNTKISEREARHLVEELMTLENPFQCPHGRPIIITMSKYEIEKKFKRIV